MSPVAAIIFTAVPPVIASIPGFFFLLACVEILIGIGMFFRHTVFYASVLLILHLLVATVSVLLTQGFSPSFPFLTLEGEFVIKNLVLLAAAIVCMGSDRKPLSGSAIMKG